MGQQSTIRITFTKTFKYPKSMLREPLIASAISKGKTDMNRFINESQIYDKLPISNDLFDIIVNEERNYKFEKPKKSEVKSNNKIDTTTAAKIVAEQIFTDKNGTLDSELNPSIFKEIKQKHHMEDGKYEERVIYVLKDEFYSELVLLQEKYNNVIKDRGLVIYE